MLGFSIASVGTLGFFFHHRYAESRPFAVCGTCSMSVIAEGGLTVEHVAALRVANSKCGS